MFGTTSSKTTGSPNPTILVMEGDSWGGFYSAWALLKYHHGGQSTTTSGGGDRVNKVIAAVRDRNNEFVRELEKMGAEIREYDPSADQEQLKRQLLRNEVDGIVLLPIHDIDNVVKYTNELIQAVSNDQKCQCMVMWSLLGVEHQGGHSSGSASSDPKQDNWKRVLKELAEIEQQVRSAKVEHQIILRHGFIAQQFFALSQVIQNRGIFPFPSKSNKFAPVNAKDLARVSSKLISSPENMNKFNKQILSLTGPRAHTAEDINRIMNSTLNSKVDFKEVSLRDLEQILEENEDVDDTEVATTLAILDLIKRDKFNVISNDIQKILGESPVDVDAFFRENADSFRPRHNVNATAPFLRDLANYGQ